MPKEPNEGVIGGSCLCVAHHTPRVNATQIHHVLPQSWGGTSSSPNTMGAGANTIEVCPTTHYNIHALLNEYVRANGMPHPSVLLKFNLFAKEMAAAAWAYRIPGHPTPYW